MTKAENISIILSLLAIGVSIISPFATYHWLDPNLKAFEDRARLQVSRHTAFESKEMPIKDQTISIDSIKPTYFELYLLNIGKLPAKDIQIVSQYEEPPTGDFVSFSPPSQYEVENQGGEVFITVKRPIPSKDSLKVQFKVIPRIISVSTESGETNVIDTGADVHEHLERTHEHLKRAIERIEKLDGRIPK